ncbi:C-C chemokine receptor-like 2 [Manis javanica]|nr:C-C chemokine receptor-like 2 [Manis javanica]
MLNQSELSQVGSPKMDNYTSAPEDEYDVLIVDDMSNYKIAQCDQYDTRSLSAHLVPPLYTTVFIAGLLEHFSLHDCKSNYDLDRSVHVLKIIAATHCCVNPFLCVFLDKEFRKHLCRLCHLCDDAPLQPEDSAQDAPREEGECSTDM